MIGMTDALLAVVLQKFDAAFHGYFVLGIGKLR